MSNLADELLFSMSNLADELLFSGDQPICSHGSIAGNESYHCKHCRIEQLTRERNNWTDTAARGMHDIAYYQELLDSTGLQLVPEIFKCDDGSTSKDMLRAKIPEIVEARMKEWREMRDILLTIHSARICMNESTIIEQLNVIDAYFKEPNYN